MRPVLATLFDLPRRALMLALRFYRFWLSPWLGAGCLFEPTCSAYSLQAIERHGAAAGAYLTVRRLLRCHPWCEAGHDPVPDAPPRLFTRLVPAAAHDAPPRPAALPLSREKNIP